MENDESREHLISLLVNGMSLSFMKFTKAVDVLDFIEELKGHYMSDERLCHLFFWVEGNIIMHDWQGIPSSFGVIIDGNSLQFRTEDGSIDNQKNAGRILMSTIAFIHNKLIDTGAIPEEMRLYKNDKIEEDSKEDVVDDDEDSDTDPDFDWL